LLRLRWKDCESADLAELLQCVPDDALDSPRRSVVPLLDFCRAPARAASALSGATKLSLGDEAEFIFEYPVRVQKGRGKASFTDLLIHTPTTVLAIEAKYTEPEYETVRSWLREPVETNRAAVLDGWLDLLNRVAARSLTALAVHDLPYQLIHRAASACFPEGQHRALAYLVFGEAAAHYSTHMNSLAALLGPTFLSLLVLSCPVTKLPAFVALERRWDGGERKLAREVRSALLAGSLFSFGELRREGGSMPPPEARREGQT
jgi:hypothetical protein